MSILMPHFLKVRLLNASLTHLRLMKYVKSIVSSKRMKFLNVNVNYWKLSHVQRKSKMMLKTG